MTSAEGDLRKEVEIPTSKAVVVNEDDDDDVPTLSSHALNALKEFLAEQNHELAAADEEVALVAEDWRLSQFWYDSQTAETVAAEVATLCETLSSPRVSCIACPTLYAYLKKIVPGVPAQLLEYDKRFEQYGNEFTFYDYNQPEDLPSSLKHSFPIVVADPPYLSKECLEKVAETIRFLCIRGECYVLLLTGAVQTDSAAELLGFARVVFGLSTRANLAMSLGFLPAMILEQGLVGGTKNYRTACIILQGCDHLTLLEANQSWIKRSITLRFLLSIRLREITRDTVCLQSKKL